MKTYPCGMAACHKRSGGHPLTKTQLLDQYASQPGERLLLAKILDKQQRAAARSVPVNSGFLSPGEQTLVRQMLSRLSGNPPLFWGGYPEAERCICIFYPEWMQEETALQEAPLRALSLTPPPAASLTHRDYLGSFMGLGLSRETLGDLLLTEQGCQALVLADVLPILLDQWESAGRCPLLRSPIPLEALRPSAPPGKLLRKTVASLRLDAVLAAAFSLSRGRAAERITAGRVSLNHFPCDKIDRMLTPGDVLSCRGLGKCILLETGGTSRKGRTVIELQMFSP